MTDKQPDALMLADFLGWIAFDRIVTDPRIEEAEAELRRLHQVEKERDVLLGMIEDSYRDAEWRDKIIWGGIWGGTARQHWALNIYLPVPLDETDKSPEAAVKRILNNAIAITKAKEENT